jgi:hypothetical protein
MSQTLYAHINKIKIKKIIKINKFKKKELQGVRSYRIKIEKRSN